MFTAAKPQIKEKIQVYVFNGLKRERELKEAIIIEEKGNTITCKLISGKIVCTDYNNVKFLK